MSAQRGRLAVVLLSGGMDSATAAAWAGRVKGFRLAALTVSYGQRHSAELRAARRVARQLGVERHVVVEVNLARIGGSALTDRRMAVPKNRSLAQPGRDIPVTYVPARNTVLLALALGLAEALGAQDIVIGVNARDYSGYPDCRPEFLRSFQRLAQVATAAGVSGRTRFRIHAPLLRLGKAQIVALGARLGVDFALTHSCYDPLTRGGRVQACGACDACRLRLKGFREAGLADPVSYANSC